MPQINIPVHPARQQGLGVPQGQIVQNPYYKPSVALSDYNGKLPQAGTATVDARAESTILGLGALQQEQQPQQLQQVQRAPEILPQQVQAEQIADGIIRGQVNQSDIAMLVQSGQVDAAVADTAVGMVQQFLQTGQGRLQQPQGLGGF